MRGRGSRCTSRHEASSAGLAARAACWLFALLAVPGCRQTSASPTGPAAAVRVHVETVDVEEADVPRFVLVTGSLEAAQQADVAAGVAGRVVSTHVERGTTVGRGAPLVVLDRRTSAATALEIDAQAKVAATQARRTLWRVGFHPRAARVGAHALEGLR